MIEHDKKQLGYLLAVEVIALLPLVWVALNNNLAPFIHHPNLRFASLLCLGIQGVGLLLGLRRQRALSRFAITILSALPTFVLPACQAAIITAVGGY